MYNCKYFFIVLAGTVMVSCSNADLKEQEDSLKYAFGLYIDLNNSRNYQDLASFLPDTVLNSSNSTEEIETLKNSSELEKTTIVYDTAFNVEALVEEDDIYYARIQYGLTTTSDFSKFKGENGMAYAMSVAVQSEKELHGKDNVRFDSESWIMTTEMKDYCYASKADTSTNWNIFYLVPFEEIYVPESIRKESAFYKQMKADLNENL